MLDEIRQRAEDDDEDARERVNQKIFQECLAYTQKFSNFKTKDAVEDVRARLSGKGLFEFEIATLVNLVPDNGVATKEYVPSLDMPGRNINEFDLDDMLDSLRLVQNQN
eukprot:Awhi_evm1s9141